MAKDAPARTAKTRQAKPKAGAATVDVPPLAHALRAHPAAKARWEALPPSHKREYATWIEGAKKADTQARRIAQAVEMLVAGRKTPMRANDAPAVSAAPLEKKLGLKDGLTFAVLDAPESYAGPKGGAHAGGADVVLAFAVDVKALGKVAAKAMRSVKDGGSLWFAFPKKTSGIPTDLSRDRGWEAVEDAGWGTAGLIALDDAWSAFRFKRGGARRT
jgi:hypothetical protein